MIEQANMRLFLCLIILSACFLISLPVSSQSLPKDIAFERVSIPGTIRSSQVTNIIQDDLGLIWLAGDGLYRYDGFKFRQYKEIGNNGAILDPQDILYLFYDKISCRLLLGTRRYGIVTYDYQSDQLALLPSQTEPPIINHIAQTSDGKIWAASFTSGLFHIERDTLKKVPGPQSQYPHPISIVAHGPTLYVGVQKKVMALEQGVVNDVIDLDWPGKDLPQHTFPTSVFIDRQKQLWVGTEKQGVLVYDLAGRKFVKHFPSSESPFFSKISGITQDRDGLIWILTKASGLVVYSMEQDRTLLLRKNPFSVKSISSDNCFSILEDRDGIIWIGATGDVNKYDRKQVKFRHIYHNPLNRISLTDNMVRGVYEDNDGKIWTGTDGGYINVIDLENETTTPIKVSPGGDSSLHVPLYITSFNDRIMLVGTPRGLLQYDRKTKKFSPFEPLWSETKGKNVRQIIRHQNNLYFIHSGSVFIHDLATGKTESFGNAGDPQAVNLTTLYLDDEQRLWAGSGKGISVYNSAARKFRFMPFRDLPSIANGSLLLVLSIQQVGNKLYVGTFNAGFWEVDISNIDAIPPPKKFYNRTGLPSNTVYATLPDDQGNLWLSTNNGLVRFDPRTERFVSFSISEGLQEEEFNRLAYAKTRTGQLIFGGINGINIFNPGEIEIEQENVVPEILSVSVQNPLAKDPVVSRITEIPDKLILDFEQNFVSIHFFIPHYKQPKRYTLFYKLESFEKEWKEVSNENNVTYANLQPGVYNFKLKTAGINGREHIVSLPIIIAAPYWRAWWFILLSVCVVAFLVMTIIRSYVRKAQYDRQRLEELLKMRTSEIEKSREELQILNQKKDLIFSILSHDLRSPLTTLKGFLGYLIDHAHEIPVEDLKKHAVSIRYSVTNSLDLIDNTLFWSLSQMGTIQYTPSTFALHHLFEKLRGLYQLTADKKRIPLSISCHEDIMLHGDENMIYVSLRNLVSNALKFTSEGNPVTITCKRRDDFVEINVVDKGIGMSPEYLKKILSADQPMLKKGTSNEKGTGLGLLLCKQFIELNKGELHITSIEHVGTTFTVLLPLSVHQPVSSHA
ncbi:hypothetical protein KK083_23865 [Fulvivirgaceae bacterium PWU4]|uniref:histidine kinase n=1 Tax=Chryseosolibacter histidini TaxID=2782349 RepID=A0AAP2DSY3_9BACT|nr:sensor histidine kinase [Chryseosolibacter histidini]MBT1699944.1 hypothetical protein [Chryseosolibacter histidini]